MLRNDSVQTKQQEDYLHYHNDGLMDIYVGFGILMIGLGMLTDIYYVFIAILPAVFIPMWRRSKKKYTAPRMKYIHFPEADRIARRTMALLTGLLMAGMLVFFTGAMVALFGSQSNGLLPVWMQAFLKDNFGLLLGTFGALVLTSIALLYKLKRYFVYAALTLVILTITSALNAPFSLMIASTGITIALFGLVVLLRFKQEYPVEKDL